MKTDIEISREIKVKKIDEIANYLNIQEDYVYLFGNKKAKIDYNFLNKLKDKKEGKLILVTAISPTPAGEGKTTVTIGIGDALKQLNKKAVICLREPSLGPVFGIKGGATGGGYSQVVPMDEINLHFTGDFHAISSAHNLLSAMIDNHIFHGNKLNLDVRKITWKRVVDMNDRQLRSIISGIGGKLNGMPREDGYDITVASEVMAILCLSKDLDDLQVRLGNIVVGYTYDNAEVTAKDLKANGAMAVLLKEAFNPNLVQTLESTPAIIHGGPFANIAHGCNSIIATKMGLKLADYVVTEAGFGADLGAEKFINIKCRQTGIKPNIVVLVATVRGLKYHGGIENKDLYKENINALKNGLNNLKKHINNIKEGFGLNCIMAINKFPTDTKNELDLIKDVCKELNVQVEVSEVFEQGGKGGIEVANKILSLIDKKDNFRFTYKDDDSTVEKIKMVSKKIYGADDIVLSDKAIKTIENIEARGYGNLPICIAKTPYSFSNDAKKLGVVENFKIHIEEIKLCAGAKFIVCITGNIMTMPGLPKIPLAEEINIVDSKVTGIF